LGELDYLLLLRLVCTLPLMMNSFVDYCKLLPERESEQIPLETNIREVTIQRDSKSLYISLHSCNVYGSKCSIVKPPLRIKSL
jgi:hypothetical protein